ncbi:MAG: BolA/IbaG family iron-sulfur metabolism protein [Buchnera aphidicola (Meitanaphis elongallis)]
MITKIIKNILTSVFDTKIFEIYNESKKHKKSMTNHSHFKIIIVSDDFTKYNLLTRHQKIYNLLSTCILKYNIHGLALHTYTINEWNSKFQKNLTSPICMNNK